MLLQLADWSWRICPLFLIFLYSTAVVAGLVVATAGGLELEDLPLFLILYISLSTAVVAGLVVATAGGLELEDLPAIPNVRIFIQRCMGMSLFNLNASLPVQILSCLRRGKK